MSRYSGKCDFADHIWMSANTEKEAFEKFKGTKLYIVQPLPEDFDLQKALDEKINIPETYYKEIKYTSIRDLIPYYPYLVRFAVCYEEKTRNSVVCLSAESFVDREERESLEFKLKRLLTIYNRCKRKKIEFNIDEAVKESAWDEYDEEIYRILAERVKEKGKKATIDGVHLKMHERYRKELVDEMKRKGLNPADYGYERFI